MTENKSMKRAVVLSAIAVLLCLLMLVGTTFAWFTDSSESKGNKVVAGDLEVKLLLRDDNGEYNNIGDQASPVFGDEDSLIAQNKNIDTIWEPNKTQIAYLAIENAGNIDLRYQVILSVKTDDGKDMNEVMQYTIVPGTDSSVVEAASWDDLTTPKVTPKKGSQIVTKDIDLGIETTHYFAFVIHMNKEADNKYENASIEFDITVLATQLTSEGDAFGNQYDADATYLYNADDPVALEGALALAMPGDVVKLAPDGDYGTYTFANSLKGVTIDANGAAIKLEVPSGVVLEDVVIKNLVIEAFDGPSNMAGAVNIRDGATADITFENCTFKPNAGYSSVRAYTVDCDLTFVDCVFEGGKYSVYSSGAAVKSIQYIGCEFKNISSWAIQFNGGDENTKNLVVENCTFDGCVGGIIKVLGQLKGESTITFVDNTVTNSTGHDGKTEQWFWISVEKADMITLSGNTLDGSEWVPGNAEGLGR